MLSRGINDSCCWEDPRETASSGISHGQVVCMTMQRAEQVFGTPTEHSKGLFQWAVAPPGCCPAFAVGD